VAAARRRSAAATTKSAAKVAIVKRDVGGPVEYSEKQKERLQHQQERQPRTKGVLFMRLSSGQLVRIDRHGEPLLLASNHSEEEPFEDIAGEERKEEQSCITESSSKQFIPAPIPKVSAWAKGT
jgi:hypothetical protein